jgi:hypothetical protein
MNIRLLGSLLVLLSSPAMAQQCTTSVLVNAFDAKTKASLHGLRASDFAASVGRDTLTVDSVHPVFRNRVLVLLDLSDRNEGASRAAVLQNTADYINEAPTGMPVAFGAFAENAVFSNGFSSDPESLASAVQRTMDRAGSFRGKSNLANALGEALTMFGRPRPGDTILLISNGDGRISRIQWNLLARKFYHHDIRLQLLMNAPITSGTDAASMLSAFSIADHINPSLIRLANRTGGVLMGFMNSEWYNAAASGYLLEVREPHAAKSKTWRLRVPNYDQEFGVQSVLFYPQQLPACSVPLLASVVLRNRAAKP